MRDFIRRNNSLYLLLLIVVPLFIGLLTFRDYGENTDENSLYLYSDYSIHAYQGLVHLNLNPDLGKGNFRFYGPAFLMGANLFARVFTSLIGSLIKTDAWHLAYFLSFYVSGLAMYFLAKRWLSELAAFATAVLFLSQPLLWGQAFINPKDMPFMSFGLISILAGLTMQDRVLPTPEAGGVTGFIKEILSCLRNPFVIVAGLILGLTGAIRVLGLFPGFIVFIICLYRKRVSAIAVVIPYFLIALVVMYFTWPYLWSNPVNHFVTSMSYMADFPWPGKVLFDGNYYTTDQLPLSYVPWLFGIQFTEPTVILFVAGMILFFYQLGKKTLQPDFAVVTALWGLLPLVAFTILRPSLYDNIRQILFLTPALFLMIGLSLEQIFQYIRKPIPSLAVLLLLVAPGIYSIVHLHPYEYIYYNAFIGGTQGAYRKFEGDYLAISFREGMEYLNQTAAPNSKVIIYGPSDEQLVTRFARPDLYLDNLSGTPYRLSDYQYAIISTRNDRDLKKFTDWQTLYVVQRDNNIFALVKQRP